jgi:hypothetical protein
MSDHLVLRLLLAFNLVWMGLYISAAIQSRTRRIERERLAKKQHRGMRIL